MADVVTALGRAVREAGHNVQIIIPKYDVINYAEVRHFSRDRPLTYSEHLLVIKLIFFSD